MAEQLYQRSVPSAIGLFDCLLPSMVQTHDVNRHIPARDERLESIEGGHLDYGERRAEYLTVRECARQAMIAMGGGVQSIGSRADRSPIWPAGWRGSMSHSSGYFAAAVGRAETTFALGIDAELNEPLPDGTLRMVASERERSMIAGLRSMRADVAWDRLLFSAKESFFKAWYPATRRWLEFEDCRVTLEPHSGTFIASYMGTPDVGGPVSRLEGNWRVASSGGKDFVLTALHVGSCDSRVRSE